MEIRPEDLKGPEAIPPQLNGLQKLLQGVRGILHRSFSNEPPHQKLTPVFIDTLRGELTTFERGKVDAQWEHLAQERDGSSGLGKVVSYIRAVLAPLRQSSPGAVDRNLKVILNQYVWYQKLPPDQKEAVFQYVRPQILPNKSS
ncbi:MAG: hypothetical protein Q7R81_06910 [Candidatus Peregrinibacteria bacterium]|nr:hypothetical protein [Candidatus Peregrinibacteria bacterium]